LLNKNILIITHALNVGGMEKSLNRYLIYLRNNDCKIDILLTEEKGSSFNYFSNNFNVIYIPNNYGSLVHLNRIRKCIKRLSPDIIISFHDKYFQALIPFLSSSIIKIVSLRNDDPYFYSLVSKNKNLINSFIVNNINIKEKLTKLVSPVPVFEIDNGIDTSQHIKLTGRLQFGFPLQLLFVGRFSHEKNVLLLPEILNECVNRKLGVFLTIIGDGPQRNELIRNINEKDFQTKVRIVGEIQYSEVIEYYRNSHILIFPSLYEGMSNVLLESLLEGCVPISNSLPGVKDKIIIDNKTGLLVNDNICSEYVDDIERLYNNKILWEGLSKNGIELIKGQFSEEKESKELIEAIKNSSFIGNHPRQSLFLSVSNIFSLINYKEFFPEFVKNIYRRLRHKSSPVRLYYHSI
jgi:glycosyltransferase involved in cell wall biosynthesis